MSQCNSPSNASSRAVQSDVEYSSARSRIQKCEDGAVEEVRDGGGKSLAIDETENAKQKKQKNFIVYNRSPTRR